MKNIKNIFLIIVIILLAIIIAGMYKFNYLSGKDGYDVDGNKIEQTEHNRNDDLCDENGNRYQNEENARKAGLTDAEFGVTYCPEYKMDSSWDVNKDGINDCYNDNSCSKDLDYMSPRIGNNTDIINEEMVIRVPLMKSEITEQFPHIIYVDQKVPKKDTILDSVYKKLFDLDMKPTDDDSIHNYIASSGLSYDSISIIDRVAIVHLSGEYIDMPLSDGNDNVRQQINSAAFQFDTVDSIRVYLNDELFDWCNVGSFECFGEEEFWIDNEDISGETMIINIPNLEWDDGVGDFVIRYNKYTVEKRPEILDSIYRKLFELNSYQGKYEGLTFESVSIDKNKIAKVVLNGGWFPAGDMSQLYFRRNIDAAAFQFDSVDGIEVYLSGELFDWCIDDVSDGEGGCSIGPMYWIDSK